MIQYGTTFGYPQSAMGAHVSASPNHQTGRKTPLSTRGIVAMAGLSPTPGNLALASFLLGWGGLSVHAQTLGAVQGTDISCARHLAGRALCGILAAVFTYIFALLLF